MAGRSYLLDDPTTRQLVVESFLLGASVTIASYNAGISAETLKKWLVQGDKDILNEEDTVQAAFAREARAAQARAAHGYLSNIDRAANSGDWRAGAWKLSKLYPDEYGSKGTVQHKVEFNWRDAVSAANEEGEVEEDDGDDIEPSDN